MTYKTMKSYKTMKYCSCWFCTRDKTKKRIIIDRLIRKGKWD